MPNEEVNFEKRGREPELVTVETLKATVEATLKTIEKNTLEITHAMRTLLTRLNYFLSSEGE